MIVLDNVGKSYGAARVLDGCSTRIARGEVVVVCGPSGSGKSTLVKCVNGLEPIDEGSIVVDGIRIEDPATDLPRLRAKIGMVFQSFELYPHMTVMENIRLAQRHVLKRSAEAATERARELLERIGLADFGSRHPATLSGGQQQRVAIARALALDPIAMLFDEPTSALDPEMINEVLDLMTELATDGMTMIVVTHEMGFARRVADRILFMDAGKIVEDTSVATFFDSPSSERAKRFLDRILRH